MPLKHFLVIRENTTILDLYDLANQTDIDTEMKRNDAKTK